MTALLQYTIYDHPRDHPDVFVVREWCVTATGLASGAMWTAPTLEAARALLPAGLFCMDRDVHDDPVIVETWT